MKQRSLFGPPIVLTENFFPAIFAFTCIRFRDIGPSDAVETVNEEGVDPSRYGALDLNPPEVVSELLEAVKRGDWDIALRYYDTTAIVRSLPEYIDVWKT